MSGPSHILAPAIWGGEQVVLEMGAERALLRLGCAQGEFPMPRAFDGHGRFSVAGTYTAFTGGPSTPGETAASAHYEGKVDGDNMTLSVRHAGGTESFQLTRGVQSKVIRCL